jgi:hypothetical protein
MAEVPIEEVIMEFKIRKASVACTCILCGKDIEVGKNYIRPVHQGLDKKVFGGVTWRERPPYFHIECWKKLRNWFKSNVNPTNDAWEEVVI